MFKFEAEYEYFCTMKVLKYIDLCKDIFTISETNRNDGNASQEVVGGRQLEELLS